MRDIMIDLETLGTDSNSVILSISAVEFDLATGETGSEFEAGLDVQQQYKIKSVIDSDTVAWWFSQDNKAIDAITRLKRDSVDKVLKDFNDWLHSIDYAPKDIRLWGNGCTFDNVILRNLYKRSNVDFILPYWCDNDVRTLVTLGNINTRDFQFKGIKHRGIDDCKHQINYCNVAYKGL
jgi:exodeoxyribonuclease VIII